MANAAEQQTRTLTAEERVEITVTEIVTQTA